MAMPSKALAAAAEAAQFGPVGQQGGGGDRSDAGGRAQHLGAPAQAGIGLDGLQQVLFESLDAVLEGLAFQTHQAHKSDAGSQSSSRR